MAKAAASDQSRAAFEKHHGETEEQIERLETIFELLSKPVRGTKCDAIEGILHERTEIMDEYANTQHLTPDCWPLRRLSSTTRSRATIR